MKKHRGGHSFQDNSVEKRRPLRSIKTLLGRQRSGCFSLDGDKVGIEYLQEL